MRRLPRRARALAAGLALAGLPLAGLACGSADPGGPQAAGCVLVEDGHGPAGTVPVRAETVVDGLEVPWGIAFLPGGDWLVTERPGRLRLVRAGALVAAPVATFPTAGSDEGGLLGIALHPAFATNRLFFLYVTSTTGGVPTNRVERWRLSEAGTSATRDRVILADFPAALYHDGGRLRVGPDGMLYVGTGDAQQPATSRDAGSPNGKLLRLTPDGDVPPDNPVPGSPVYVRGLRNLQAFDWPLAPAGADGTVWLVDHGPTGELLRQGHDEVSVARPGDDLGWPTIYGCRAGAGLVSPVLTWRDATPPGGAAVYTGTRIPEWRGSFLVGTLRSEHLQRVVIEGGRAVLHETYFEGDFGRLREVVMSPDGELYVTTSNCDGRGTCPAGRDRILRLTR